MAWENLRLNSKPHILEIPPYLHFQPSLTYSLHPSLFPSITSTLHFLASFSTSLPPSLTHMLYPFLPLPLVFLLPS